MENLHSEKIKNLKAKIEASETIIRLEQLSIDSAKQMLKTLENTNERDFK